MKKIILCVTAFIMTLGAFASGDPIVPNDNATNKVKPNAPGAKKGNPIGEIEITFNVGIITIRSKRVTCDKDQTRICYMQKGEDVGRGAAATTVDIPALGRGFGGSLYATPSESDYGTYTETEFQFYDETYFTYLL
jgi:hypothetical protein